MTRGRVRRTARGRTTVDGNAVRERGRSVMMGHDEGYGGKEGDKRQLLYTCCEETVSLQV